MTDRLIIDDDYAWIDTTTGWAVEVEDAFNIINEQHREIQQLQGELAHYKLLLMSLEEEAKRLCEIHKK